MGSRFMKLDAALYTEHKGGAKVDAKDKRALFGMIDRRIAANAKTVKSFKKLLKTFYKVEGHGAVTLEATVGGWNIIRLQPADADEFIDIAKRDKQKRLKLYHQEVDRFASYLEHLYFPAP